MLEPQTKTPRLAQVRLGDFGLDAVTTHTLALLRVLYAALGDVSAELDVPHECSDTDPKTTAETN